MLMLLVMICYSKKYNKCIKPGSNKKCRKDNDCCYDGRPVSCYYERCTIWSQRWEKGIECDYDIECISKKCDMKNGKKVCI